VSDLIGGQVVICIIPWGLLVRVNFLDGVQAKLVEIIWVLSSIGVSIQAPQYFLIFLVALISASTYIVVIGFFSSFDHFLLIWITRVITLLLLSRLVHLVAAPPASLWRWVSLGHVEPGHVCHGLRQHGSVHGAATQEVPSQFLKLDQLLL
jgi:hypothetical protein